MSNESLFFQAFVYLVSAVIAVPVARRLGLSSVLGYLVAGMLIGPFVLGLVGREQGTDVMHFAEFGVVMMLFLVGLELQPSMLWRMRAPILGLGGLQVLGTTVAVTGVAMLCGLAWQPALAIGMALALSSTAIVLQSLQEKGLARAASGRAAFSVLLFQDIAVIPMLATFPLLATLEPEGGDGHHGGGNALSHWIEAQPAWMTTLVVLAAVVAIILAGRYLLNPLLGLVARTRVREAFVALALVLVIGIALLMTSLGVSAALGTFLAGVVLADSSYRHELEADIEPFKGLLLGVFFISVGASIDFSLVAAKPGVVVSVVLGLVALKAAVLFAVGRVGKLGTDQRVVFALYLAQGSEFAFVLLGFGASEGVLATTTAQLVIAAVALSMALTPLVMMVEEKLLRPRFGTRESADREADEIDEEAPVILAGVGRFGNFVARLLRSQKVGVTVIDHDSDFIEFLRKIGIKAYYGDANRHDLLEAAGAARARLLICTLDDEEKVTRLIHTVRKHFPHLRIMARALSRDHEFELIDEEIDFAIHQHAGSAIELGEAALVRLGFRAHQAARAARSFARHDHKATLEIASARHDEKSFISSIRQNLDELEQRFETDQQRRRRSAAAPWNTEQIREDTASGEFPEVGGGSP